MRIYIHILTYIHDTTGYWFCFSSELRGSNILHKAAISHCSSLASKFCMGLSPEKILDYMLY